MAHYTGALLAVTLDESPLDGIRAVTIPEEHPAPDVTHAADTHGQSIAGGITYHNGCTMEFVDDDGEASFDALVGGTEGELVVYPDGDGGSVGEVTMDIIVTKRDRKIAYNEAVLFVVTFNAITYNGLGGEE
jgi:hypothetical protein